MQCAQQGRRRHTPRWGSCASPLAATHTPNRGRSSSRRRPTQQQGTRNERRVQRDARRDLRRQVLRCADWQTGQGTGSGRNAFQRMMEEPKAQEAVIMTVAQQRLCVRQEHATRAAGHIHTAFDALQTPVQSAAFKSVVVAIDTISDDDATVQCMMLCNAEHRRISDKARPPDACPRDDSLGVSKQRPPQGMTAGERCACRTAPHTATTLLSAGCSPVQQ